MADSLKTRVGRVVAGSLHALIDKLEAQAPESLQQQLQREAAAALDDVRHELGRASAARHLAQQQHARLNAEHERLHGHLDEALAAAREDLARAAVARQLDIEAQLPVLETQLAELARQEQELKGYLAALLAKQRELPAAPEAPRADPALHELDALVREQQIAARLAQLKAGPR
ncbi:MAG: PspA/IM30 family protein [Burkholderiales bacterium]|nr:PspA/IM30 family protein [Burkholderiales bacterium]